MNVSKPLVCLFTCLLLLAMFLNCPIAKATRYADAQVDFTVTRMNDTWVRSEFSNNLAWSVLNASVAILHDGNIIDTWRSYTSNDWIFDWHQADTPMDYYVNLTLIKNGKRYSWLQLAPSLFTPTFAGIGWQVWLAVGLVTVFCVALAVYMRKQRAEHMREKARVDQAVEDYRRRWETKK